MEVYALFISLDGKTQAFLEGIYLSRDSAIAVATKQMVHRPNLVWRVDGPITVKE